MCTEILFLFHIYLDENGILQICTYPFNCNTIAIRSSPIVVQGELLYALVLNHKLLLERNFKIMCIILLKLHKAICTGFAHLLKNNSCHMLKNHVFREKKNSFEVLTIVLSKNKVFWYAMPCQLASSHRYFKGS